MSHKVYEIVTDRILGLLKKGVVPWRKPWNVANGPRLPRNLISGKPYRGLNVFLLAASEFQSPYFLTFRQARERGGSVRRGGHGFPVVYWNFVEREEERASGATFTKRIPFLRYYTVFNVEQTEGIDYPKEERAVLSFKPIDEAERVVNGIPAPRPEIRHDGGDRAFYAPLTDSVHLPARESFGRPEEYHSTLFHELTHATGHKSRLNRPDLAAYNGRDGSRPREELTAEMGAAFLCARAGIEQATIENSAAYLASWLRHLEGDPRLVVVAAGQAQRAVDWLLGVKRDEEPEEAREREQTGRACPEF